LVLEVADLERRDREIEPNIARRAKLALIAARDCSLDVRMLSASGNPRFGRFAELIECLP
jgi:hypothetical protein